MYQQLIIVGRLGRDPEMRYTADGKPVTSLSVATDRVWNDASGQKQSKTVWFKVAVWGNQAEPCSKYLSKGRMVLVEGELSEPRVWQDKQGEHRASLEVRASTVKFLGGGEKAEGAGTMAAAQSDLGEEEIPF